MREQIARSSISKLVALATEFLQDAWPQGMGESSILNAVVTCGACTTQGRHPIQLKEYRAKDLLDS